MRKPPSGHDIVAIATTTFKEFREDDLQGAAAEIAYHVLFSTVPLLLFLTALTSFVSRQIGVESVMDDITQWLRENLPENTAEAVLDPIETVIETEAGGILSFGAATALWGGKNAMAALIKGLNAAYGAAESRPWWKKQLVAIGLTLALGGAIVLSSVIFVVGAAGGRFLADFVGLSETWATVWSLLQWPLVVVLLVTALAAFYWAAPNVDVPFMWLPPGSVLAVVAWAIATVGLGYYFSTFAGYTAYGALGAVMAFVFWLYVMNLILLLGGELNAVVEKRSGVVRPAAGADRTERAATGPDPNAAERPDHRGATDADRTTNRFQSAGRATPRAAAGITPGGSTWRRIAGRAIAAGIVVARRLGRRGTGRGPVPDAAPPAAPLTRAAFARWDDRTVGELRAAVEAGVVAKTELQVYGLDWSQLATERDDAPLADVVARRGARVGLDR